jgi:hypothetical protein
MDVRSPWLHGQEDVCYLLLLYVGIVSSKWQGFGGK